jgi:hypothetical protein
MGVTKMTLEEIHNRLGKGPVSDDSTPTPKKSYNGVLGSIIGGVLGIAIGATTLYFAYAQPQITQLKTGYETRITAQQRYQAVQDSTAVAHETAATFKIDSLEKRVAIMDDFFPGMSENQMQAFVDEHNDYQKWLVNLGLVKFDENGNAYDVK